MRGWLLSNDMKEKRELIIWLAEARTLSKKVQLTVAQASSKLYSKAVTVIVVIKVREDGYHQRGLPVYLV